MKKFLAVLFLCVFTMSAQNKVIVGSGSVSLGVQSIQSWKPFTSDSLATAWSVPFDVSQFDSVWIYAACTSINGVPNFLTVVQVAPLTGISTTYPYSASSLYSSANSYDSIGVAGDTTKIKSEKLSFLAGIFTRGAVALRLKLNPTATTNGLTANHKDDVVNFILTGRKRAYTGPN